MKEDADRKNVGAVIDRVGGVDDLRGGVVGCSKNFLAFFDFAFDGTCESEVPDFWEGVDVEEDIGGLDIAVDDSVFVGVSESLADAAD